MSRRKITGRSEFIGEANPPPPRLALSILEFCDAHGISEGFYYKLRKQHLHPREMRLGTRTLITVEAAAAWRAEREAASAAEVEETPAPPAKPAEAKIAQPVKAKPAKPAPRGTKPAKSLREDATA